MVTLLAGPAVVWPGEPAPIRAQQLMVWMDAPDPPLILDVRGHQAYLEGTLPGAFDAGRDPLGYLPDGSGHPVVLLPPEVFDTARREAWTARLTDTGHPVWLLTGGITAWIEHRGAVEQPDVTYTQPGRVPFMVPKGMCEGGDPAQVFE